MGRLEDTEGSVFSGKFFHQVRETQALILAPTRELAVQIQKVRWGQAAVAAVSGWQAQLQSQLTDFAESQFSVV